MDTQNKLTLDDITHTGFNAIRAYETLVGDARHEYETVIKNAGDALTDLLRQLYHSGVADGLIQEGDLPPWFNADKTVREHSPE